MPTPKQAPHCADGKCGECVRGGLPLQKQTLTLIVIVALIGSTVLGVLYINALRQIDGLRASKASSKETTEVNASSSATPIAYPLPAEAVYEKTVVLPKPKQTGTISLEQAIATRRTRRDFSKEVNVTVAELSQVLWAGQGVTDVKTGKRTAPSARETYPSALFVVVRTVDGLEPGLYEYLPLTNSLGKLPLADAGTVLSASGVQEGAKNSPVVILVTASFGKSAKLMKDGAVSASTLEAGHIAQNIYLQTEAQKMATVAMAGFDAKKVAAALKLDPAYTILYAMPYGHRGVEAVVQE